MGVETDRHKDMWRDSVVRAAAEASRLQPLASILLVASLVLILGQYVIDPMTQWFGWSGGGGSFQDFAMQVVEALPPLILAWGLWETRNYLGRLSKGEVWGPATALLLGRIGDCLLWAAAIAMFVVPNVQNWMQGGFGGFDWRFDGEYLVLAGLGLLLSLIARVVRNVVEVAAALKAENDEIV
ncbi:MAG: DUF2975 domain-containing protein [Terricaulis sp.]